ncbi:MAG: DUF3365 domain-containing protein [Oxalobacteraceae bacterium]|nr:DUF3365 domain-containing protein [Oxalobacteraceae bacterium]
MMTMATQAVPNTIDAYKVNRSLSTLLNRALLIAVFSAGLVQAQTVPAGLTPAEVESTRGVASALLNQLGQALKISITNDGPVAAVGVCKDVAPSIAASLSSQQGVQVKRVGTRVRNPNAGVPNGWQKEALSEFESRLAQGEKPADLEYWRVVDGAQGKRELRFAKAIVTQQLCITCHGKPEDIPAPLLEKIRAEYLQDDAIGYRVGQLRGAVVVTRALGSDR